MEIINSDPGTLDHGKNGRRANVASEEAEEGKTPKLKCSAESDKNVRLASPQDLKNSADKLYSITEVKTFL